MDINSKSFTRSMFHTYQKTCTDNNEEKFEITYSKFQQDWAQSWTFHVESGWAQDTPPFNARTFAKWLREGPCPPRNPDRTGKKIKIGNPLQRLERTLSFYNGMLDGWKSLKDPDTDTADFFKNNWKVMVITTGLSAMAAFGLWASSGFIIANDVTGVGVIDDPALGVTVPAATAATAITAAQITALAAGVLLYMGVSSPR